jgi:predicted aldo/keto reductase-like oxidoreductase
LQLIIIIIIIIIIGVIYQKIELFTMNVCSYRNVREDVSSSIWKETIYDCGAFRRAQMCPEEINISDILNYIFDVLFSLCVSRVAFAFLV